MWWVVEKLTDDKERIVYAYSRENHNLDGRFEYLKADGSLNFITLSEGDTDWDVRKFWPHALRLIEDGAPMQKMIATG